MLVLTRKLHETVRIGDDIEITVGRIEGDTVRLMIHAPRHVAVYRGELYERIKTCNREALLPAATAGAAVLPKLDKRTPHRVGDEPAA